MKLISSISILVIMLLSCNPPKTVFVSNKTGKAITLLVDGFYNNPDGMIFKNSLNGLRIVDKKVFNFGNGKWTETDKSSLEDMLKHTKIIEDGNTTPSDIPAKIKVSKISFNVEELWVRIK